MPESPIAEMFHVLDMFAKTLNWGREVLLPVIQCLGAEHYQSSVDFFLESISSRSIIY